MYCCQDVMSQDCSSQSFCMDTRVSGGYRLEDASAGHLCIRISRVCGIPELAQHDHITLLAHLGNIPGGPQEAD